MEQHNQQLKELVRNIGNSSFELNAQMIRLDAVQDAVAQLMVRIDEIKYKGWDNDRGTAYLSIGEIERIVRLIDMAFLPLKREIEKTVKELDISSDRAFELVVKGEE